MLRPIVLPSYLFRTSLPRRVHLQCHPEVPLGWHSVHGLFCQPAVEKRAGIGELRAARLDDKKNAKAVDS